MGWAETYEEGVSHSVVWGSITGVALRTKYNRDIP